MTLLDFFVVVVGTLFSSGDAVKAPKTFRFKFTETGTYAFECPLYKDRGDALMGGIVFVSEPMNRPGLQNSDRGEL